MSAGGGDGGGDGGQDCGGDGGQDGGGDGGEVAVRVVAVLWTGQAGIRELGEGGEMGHQGFLPVGDLADTVVGNRCLP